MSCCWHCFDSLLTIMLLPQFVIAVTMKQFIIHFSRPLDILMNEFEICFSSVLFNTRNLYFKNYFVTQCASWNGLYPSLIKNWKGSFVNTLVIKTEHLLKLLLIVCIFCWSTFSFGVSILFYWIFMIRWNCK